jgi:protein required for attachment to host cells
MNTWMVVADAAGARVFDFDRGEMRLVRDEANAKGRARAQDLAEDRPGRLLKGRGRNIRSSMEPRTSPHDVEEQHFAQRIGQMLDDSFARRDFRWLVFVAPPHFMGLLRGTLTDRLYQAVIASLERDYTKLDQRALQLAISAALTELTAERRKREMTR